MRTFCARVKSECVRRYCRRRRRRLGDWQARETNLQCCVRVVRECNSFYNIFVGRNKCKTNGPRTQHAHCARMQTILCTFWFVMCMTHTTYVRTHMHWTSFRGANVERRAHDWWLRTKCVFNICDGWYLYVLHMLYVVSLSLDTAVFIIILYDSKPFRKKIKYCNNFVRCRSNEISHSQ